MQQQHKLQTSVAASLHTTHGLVVKTVGDVAPPVHVFPTKTVAQEPAI